MHFCLLHFYAGDEERAEAEAEGRESGRAQAEEALERRNCRSSGLAMVERVSRSRQKSS